MLCIASGDHRIDTGQAGRRPRRGRGAAGERGRGTGRHRLRDRRRAAVRPRAADRVRRGAAAPRARLGGGRRPPQPLLREPARARGLHGLHTWSRWAPASLRRVRRLLLLALAIAAAWPVPSAGAQRPPGLEPAAVPGERQIESARRYVRSRRGVNSFALLDSNDRLRGFAPRRTYVTASVIKAMLLVAYLRKIGNRMPNAAERGALGPMITVSDNRRASSTYRARRRRRPAPAGEARRDEALLGGRSAGAIARFSAEDQARFMAVFDRLTPPALALLRAPAALLDRALAALGLLPPLAGRGLGDLLQGRLARHRPRPARPRGGAVREGRRALLAGRAHRRQPLAWLRHRHAAGRGGKAVRPDGRERRDPREPRARPPIAAPGSRTCSATRPACSSTSATHAPTTSPAPACPATASPGRSCAAPAARDLGAVERDLSRRGLGLLILDAYRPARASRALVRWAERTGRGHLVGTYIARRCATTWAARWT